jgi:ATP-dependent exoDNAse (exonuclease V) beta subunit
MVDSYEYDQIYQKAAEKTLMLIEEEEYQTSVASVLLYLDNHVDRFYRLIVHMLSKREQWLPKLYIKGALDINSLERTAQDIIIEHLGALKQVASELLGAEFFSLLAMNKRDDVTKITKLPGINLSDLSEWQVIAELLLTKNGDWRKQVDIKIGFPTELKEQKSAFREILEALNSAESFRTMLNELYKLPSEHFPESTSRNINDIAQVLKLAVAQLKIIFTEEELQDFSEVAMQAIRALDSREVVSDIALLLDYQIKHLLIDEFQDTSYSQLNLIERLVEGWQEGDDKSLFLVGDPMQSIYRFRESQVGIFIQVMRNGIANLNINSLILTTNFRSNKSIVEINNSIFSQIFPSEDNLLQGAITFSKSTSASKKEPKDVVNFYPYSYNQDLQESEQVVAIIKDSLKDNPNQEIAVLVKSRIHLKEIISSLQSHKINFEAIKTEPLKLNLFTRDLISLARSLLSLGDRLAWLSILRAPWCGLTLEDLLIVSNSNEMTIFHQLNSKKLIEKLSEDGIQRSQHLCQAIEEAIMNEGRFSFVERFSYALSQLCNDLKLTKEEWIIRSQFLSLVSECELNQTLNIETLQSMLKGLYAPSQSASVKLMTIHQAKGLEFETVIVPGLGKTGKSDSLALIQVQEISDNSILLAPIKSSNEKEESKTYLYLKHLQKQQTYFEMMRLLYVAMSRAKEKLYLLGSVTKSGNVASNSFLSLLSQYYQQSIANIKSETSLPSKEPIPPKMVRYKELSVLPKREINNKNHSKNIVNNIDLIYQSAVGSIVHYYLEHSLFEPPIKSIETKFLELGLPQRLIQSYSSKVCRLLVNTKRDKDFDWLFMKRESTEVESEYSNHTKTVIIDRLFIDNGILWIIDFKTATLNEDESINSFIERQKHSHHKQLLEYQEILEEVFRLPSRLALYCPSVSQLILL